MQRTLKIAIAFVAASVIVAACKPNEVVNRRSSGACRKPTTSLELLAIVDYTTDVAPIINGKCATCHGANGKKPPLNTYANIKANHAAAVAAVVAGEMPPNGTKLTSAEQTTLKNWALGGFVETKSTTGTNTSTNYSYVNDIQPLLAQKCLGCHKAGGNTKPDLSTYALVKANATSIATAIATDKMPPSGPLTTDEKAKMAAWVAAGAPNTTSTTTTTDTHSDDDGHDHSDDATGTTGC